MKRRLVDILDEKTTIEFKLDGFLRTSPEARSQYYSQMSQNGVMTRNEIRKLENLPPIDGGDELTAQSNLVPLHRLVRVAPTSSPPDGQPVRE